jgi:branched-chain amino acid transport system ATP-binding protein
LNAILQLAGINARYGESQVLWDVDFAVETGRITALVGSNGAGKTTLLRVISGLMRPVSGSVVFDGEEISHVPAEARVARGIALVPEGRRLFAGLSVRENLRLGGFSRRGRAGRGDLAPVWKHFPELEGIAGQIAGTLSGGQQQMCAIGRALMARPRLLLVDEMSLGLAPVIVDRLAEALRDLNRTDGTTIVLVEQDVDLALEIAHQGYVLDTGRMVMHGDSQSLRDDPRIREAFMGVAV